MEHDKLLAVTLGLCYATLTMIVCLSDERLWRTIQFSFSFFGICFNERMTDVN